MAETMTLQQLSEYLQMSIDSVYHLVGRGKIPGIKVGKQWRFSKAAIDQWLASETGKAVSVLVVDNTSAVGDLILSALHARGHRAVGVDTYQQTAAVLGQVVFDYVILSLSLPEDTCTNIIRLAQALPRQPEIMVTCGLDDWGSLRSVIEILPYTVVLRKPVDLHVLGDLIVRRNNR